MEEGTQAVKLIYKIRGTQGIAFVAADNLPQALEQTPGAREGVLEAHRWQDIVPNLGNEFNFIALISDATKQRFLALVDALGEQHVAEGRIRSVCVCPSGKLKVQVEV